MVGALPEVQQALLLQAVRGHYQTTHLLMRERETSHNHQSCGSGSRIRCILTSRSGIRPEIEKNSDSGSGINNPDLIFENLVSVFWVKNTYIL
jgi:hypothetical protein